MTPRNGSEDGRWVQYRMWVYHTVRYTICGCVVRRTPPERRAWPRGRGGLTAYHAVHVRCWRACTRRTARSSRPRRGTLSTRSCGFYVHRGRIGIGIGIGIGKSQQQVLYCKSCTLDRINLPVPLVCGPHCIIGAPSTGRGKAEGRSSPKLTRPQLVCPLTPPRILPPQSFLSLLSPSTVFGLLPSNHP